MLRATSRGEWLHVCLGRGGMLLSLKQPREIFGLRLMFSTSHWQDYHAWVTWFLFSDSVISAKSPSTTLSPGSWVCEQRHPPSVRHNPHVLPAGQDYHCPTPVLKGGEDCHQNNCRLYHHWNTASFLLSLSLQTITPANRTSLQS